MRYGFVGLGIMGTAMASKLVRAGYELTVWNRHEDRCEPLVALGAARAATVKEVVAASDVTFAMLSTPAAAEAVCLGPDGVLEGLAPGKGYVDMSTIDPYTSRDLAHAVREEGGRFLEAPVSGSRQPAEEGSLVFMTAGDEDLYRETAPLLDVMGKKRLFLGEVGQAARMKLVVNMIMGGMMAAFSEGLSLAVKSKLDAEKLLEVLDSSAMANPMFRGKGPLMLARDFATAFPLKHMEKDLRLAVELGAECTQYMPVTEEARELFARALEAGLGDEDFSAVCRTVCD